MLHWYVAKNNPWSPKAGSCLQFWCLVDIRCYSSKGIENIGRLEKSGMLALTTFDDTYGQTPMVRKSSSFNKTLKDKFEMCGNLSNAEPTNKIT